MWKVLWLFMSPRHKTSCAEPALASVRAQPLLRAAAIVEIIVHGMLVIEEDMMQSYILEGFNWSCVREARRAR